ncbi:hypothetical protein GALL_89960 [mine drainage metagenome]|uniref:Uncharacterized protein n=1 Tax=mine drainage metagenome TaxID=410659 RepID=A0A1J5SKJ7_9ZZZZ
MLSLKASTQRSGGYIVIRSYTFERLRAKVLYTDMLQKRVLIQDKVRVRKRQKFDEVNMAGYFSLVGSFQDEYETKLQNREAILGTDLPTLIAQIDEWES